MANNKLSDILKEIKNAKAEVKVAEKALAKATKKLTNASESAVKIQPATAFH